MAAVIEMEGVGRRFGAVVAVQDVSLGVEAGEVVGLLGPNGAGKTTLLRMVATLLRPDRGRIRVAGRDVVRDSLGARSQLGFQTGDTGIYERLTPREFLRFSGETRGIRGAALASRIQWVSERMALASFVDRPCGGLSTGQRQRVVLARTLLAPVPALVLDEPTSGLDLQSSAFLLRAMREEAEGGRAVIFSSHRMEEIELVCDRIVLLHEGRLRASGTLEELLQQTESDRLSHAFLRLTGGEDASALLRRATPLANEGGR